MEQLKKNINKIFIFIILICVLLLSIGFSALSVNNNIIAQSIIRIQKDIRITGIDVYNISNGALSIQKDYNVDNIVSEVNLPNANSTITYQIELTNVGNIEQCIFAIDEIYKLYNTNIDSNLEIKNNTINLKETLCDDTNANKCKLGSITTFYITIGYKNNGYDENNLLHSIILTFDFRKVFNITYVGFSGNTSLLDNNMIEGEVKTITFNNATGIPITVSISGANGSYSSPTLSLTNAIDNIIVTDNSSTPSNQYVYAVNVGQYVLHNNPVPDSVTLYSTPEEAMLAFNNRPIYFKHLIENNIVVESYLEFVITPEMVQEFPDLTVGTYTLRGGINEEELSNKPIFDANVNAVKQAFGENSWFCSYPENSTASCNPGLPSFYVEVFPGGSVGIYLYDDMYCSVDSDGDSNCGS